MHDTALVPDLTEGVEVRVPSVRVVRIADASHWVQHERPVRSTASSWST